MKRKPCNVAEEGRGEVFWENSQHWLEDILSLLKDEKKILPSWANTDGEKKEQMCLFCL